LRDYGHVVFTWPISLILVLGVHSGATFAWRAAGVSSTRPTRAFCAARDALWEFSSN